MHISPTQQTTQFIFFAHTYYLDADTLNRCVRIYSQPNLNSHDIVLKLFNP